MKKPSFRPALFGIAALMIVAPLAQAQVRGEALYERLGDRGLVQTDGTTRVTWLPNGDFLDAERVGASTTFARVDARSGDREPLFDDATVRAMADEYSRLTGSSVSGLPPFRTFEYVLDGEAIFFTAEEADFLYRFRSRRLTKLERPHWELPLSADGLMRGLANSQLARGTYSPDYSRFARVKDYDIHVTNTTTGEERQVTWGGSEEVMNGRPDWLYPEELGQSIGFWWSPDNSKIAYLQFDVREVYQYPIVHDLDAEARLEEQRYSKAGETNPTVKLFVVDVENGESVEVDTHSSDQVYIVRGAWLPDGSEVTFQRLNRHQNRLELMAANPSTGSVRTILTEVDDAFVTLTRDLTFLDDGQFLWTSERTGWRHIYLYDVDGTMVRPLTEGAWPVGSISRVDRDGGWAYFTGFANNALESHLFRVKLDGSGFQKLTVEPGTHSASVDPSGAYFTDTFSSLTQASTTTLRRADGRAVRTLATSSTEGLDALRLEAPELVTVTAADGVTPLNGLLFKPAGYDPSIAYPMIVTVYGGPSGPRIRNTYQMMAGEQRLAQLGYMVWKMDNRGTGNRGKAFQAATYLKLGQVDLADQAAGVRQITSRPYIDGSRVGIYGGSYGGYMTAMALLKEPEVFHVGVAGSSVTDWRNYDTAYTERYMRTPQENPDGYEKGSALPYAGNLTGKLLMTHGSTDNNVHPGNTMQLVEALIGAGKTFDLMIYPQQRHGIGGAGRQHVTQLRLDYFRRHLHPQPVGGNLVQDASQ
jgi:dipeptidyl-peptidase-4